MWVLKTVKPEVVMLASRRANICKLREVLAP